MQFSFMISAKLQLFFDAISPDPDFLLSLENLSCSADVVAFAASLGFTISINEIDALSEELQPQDLEAVC